MRLSVPDTSGLTSVGDYFMGGYAEGCSGLTSLSVPDGYDVCHSCDNPSCINPKHLFLGTEGDNMRDMYSKDRHPLPPERCATVKLTREKVMKAKELRQKYGLPYQRIAKMFGVGKKAILDAVKGVTWKCCRDNDHEPKEAKEK